MPRSAHGPCLYVCYGEESLPVLPAKAPHLRGIVHAHAVRLLHRHDEVNALAEVVEHQGLAGGHVPGHAHQLALQLLPRLPRGRPPGRLLSLAEAAVDFLEQRPSIEELLKVQGHQIEDHDLLAE